MYIHTYICLWQSGPSYKTNREFFQAVSVTVWLHHLDTNKTLGEKAGRELYKDAACSLKQVLEASLHKRAAVQPLTSYHTNHPSKTNKTCWMLLEKQGQTHK